MPLRCGLQTSAPNSRLFHLWIKSSFGITPQNIQTFAAFLLVWFNMAQFWSTRGCQKVCVCIHIYIINIIIHVHLFICNYIVHVYIHKYMSWMFLPSASAMPMVFRSSQNQNLNSGFRFGPVSWNELEPWQHLFSSVVSSPKIAFKKKLPWLWLT